MATPTPIGFPLTTRRGILLLILLGAAFLYPLWTTGDIAYSRDSDIIAENAGIKALEREAVATEGRIPLWNPSMNAGTPEFANPQSMYLFPFDLLFLVLPLGVATNLVILLNFLLAGVAAFLFARRHLSHPASALVCAAAYMLSHRYLAMIYAGWLPKMSMFALTPLLFWACDRVLDRPAPRTVAVLALVGALALLQGDMQQLYYAALACAAWTVLRLCLSRAPRPGSALPGLVLSGLLALLLAAPALLPRLEFAALSTRTEFSLDFLLQNAPTPADLRTFVDPHSRDFADHVRDLFWENNFYFGLALVPLWLMAFLGNRKRAALLLLGIAVAILLSFDTGIVRWLYGHFPGFRLFRQPSRILLLAQFGAVLLAGLGADALLAPGATSRRAGGFAAASLAVAGAAWLFPIPWDGRLLALTCAAIAAVGFAGLFLRRAPLALAGLLVALPVADAALRCAPFIATAPLDTAVPGRPFDILLDRRHNDGRVLAMGTPDIPAYGRAVILYGTAGRLGIEMINGAASLELRHFVEYLSIMVDGSVAGLPHHPLAWTDCDRITRPDLLRALDARYVVGSPDSDLRGVGATKIWESPRMPLFVFYSGILPLPVALWRVDHPLGPAFFATAVHPVGGDDESLRLLSGSASARDASVFGAGPELANLDFSGGTASFAERGIDRYRYRVESAGRNFLILSQVWYPGWRATLDGAPARLYRTDHALIGCAVPPGSHELVLRMTCPPLRTGLLLALPGAIAVLLMLSWRRRAAV